MFRSWVDAAPASKRLKLDETSTVIRRCIQFSGPSSCIQCNPDDAHDVSTGQSSSQLPIASASVPLPLRDVLSSCCPCCLSVVFILPLPLPLPVVAIVLLCFYSLLGLLSGLTTFLGGCFVFSSTFSFLGRDCCCFCL